MRQIKQLRKGLKETMLWPLLCQRSDVLPVIFPREENDVLTPVVCYFDNNLREVEI